MWRTVILPRLLRPPELRRSVFSFRGRFGCFLAGVRTEKSATDLKRREGVLGLKDLIGIAHSLRLEEVDLLAFAESHDCLLPIRFLGLETAGALHLPVHHHSPHGANLDVEQLL